MVIQDEFYLTIDGVETLFTWKELAIALQQYDCVAGITSINPWLGYCNTSIGAAVSMDSFLLLFCGVLVMLMQAGFVLVENGSSHTRGTKCAITKSLIDCCMTAIILYIYSFTLSFVDGDNVFGYGGGYSLQGAYFNINDKSHSMQRTYQFWFFQWAQASVATSIVSLSVSGRIRCSFVFAYVTAFLTLVYPAVVHWAWSETGWASAIRDTRLLGVGVIDFSGSGVIHVVGGMTALMACLAIGPRVGRFDSYGEALPIEAFEKQNLNNLPYYSAGTMLIWIGFYGITCGNYFTAGGSSYDVLGKVIANVTIAAVTSGLSVFLWSKCFTFATDGHTFNFHHIMVSQQGIIAGLVSISASCATVDPEAAVVIGFVSSVLYCIVAPVVLSYEIDDSLNAVTIHLICGIWGVIAAGLFSTAENYALLYRGQPQSCGIFYSCNGNGPYQLTANIVFLLTAMGWTAVLTALLFFPLNTLGKLRLSKDDEMGIECLEYRELATSCLPKNAIYALGSKYQRRKKN